MKGRAGGRLWIVKTRAKRRHSLRTLTRNTRDGPAIRIRDTITLHSSAHQRPKYLLHSPSTRDRVYLHADDNPPSFAEEVRSRWENVLDALWLGGQNSASRATPSRPSTPFALSKHGQSIFERGRQKSLTSYSTAESHLGILTPVIRRRYKHAPWLAWRFPARAGPGTVTQSLTPGRTIAASDALRQSFPMEISSVEVSGSPIRSRDRSVGLLPLPRHRLAGD